MSELQVETHICQWGTSAETEVNGTHQYRCQLSWSDGKQCDQSTTDYASITRTFYQSVKMTVHEIMRRRYYFGEYANACMLMNADEFAHVRRWSPAESPTQLLSPDAAFQQLMGIPIVVDQSVPYDTWRLVNEKDHSQVIHEGRLSAECPNRTTQDPMEQCVNCELPFDTIRHRYLCPHCKTKNSCCF